MRVISFMLILILMNVPHKLLAQFFEENFDYATGKLVSVSTNWSESPTGSVDIQVVSGNLSYSGYASSGIGNEIFLDGGATRSGVKRAFSKVSGNGNVVYFSFLISVQNNLDLDSNNSSGDYFANFQTVGGRNRGYVYIRQGSAANTVNIGLAKSSSSSLQWCGNDLNVGSTVLLVVGYYFQSGYDAVKLWVNPDLSGVQPPADLSITSGTDADTLTYVQFRQRTASGNIYVDGVRVGVSWSDAPLPVELTDFSAYSTEEGVVLSWTTATEVDNYGFEIQRKNSPDGSNRWRKIGFVFGKIVSNSPTYYSFTDNTPMATNFYRLKQIDITGGVEYSKILRVDYEYLNFKLCQNRPNPFNPMTTISFEIPRKEPVILEVFDPGGKIVKMLVNGIKGAGWYNVIFNGVNLSSGVYFYRLIAGNRQTTKRMVLVK